MDINIHIAGPIRAGKTTLARNLQKLLSDCGLRSALIDVDKSRTGTFGRDEPILGTLNPDDNPRDKELRDLQRKMQGWAYNNVFAIQIPLVIEAGAIPIFTATHASLLAYTRAADVAKQFNRRLCFFLLEDTSFEEVVRRAAADDYSMSDMRDPLNNPAERRNYEDTLRRVHETYDRFTEPLIRIPQGTPDQMAQAALSFLLGQTVRV